MLFKVLFFLHDFSLLNSLPIAPHAPPHTHADDIILHRSEFTESKFLSYPKCIHWKDLINCLWLFSSNCSTFSGPTWCVEVIINTSICFKRPFRYSCCCDLSQELFTNKIQVHSVDCNRSVGVSISTDIIVVLEDGRFKWSYDWSFRIRQRRQLDVEQSVTAFFIYQLVLPRPILLSSSSLGKSTSDRLPYILTGPRTRCAFCLSGSAKHLPHQLLQVPFSL